MSDIQAIMEQANSIDDEVQFTEDACEQLARVPSFVLDMALKGVVKKAKEQGVTTIDAAFVEASNPMK